MKPGRTWHPFRTPLGLAITNVRYRYAIPGIETPSEGTPFLSFHVAGGPGQTRGASAAQIALSPGGGFDSFATILSVLRP
jgi:hypothetical protein